MNTSRFRPFALISVSLGALLSVEYSAGQAADAEFAITLPSARVELRDAPSESELLAPTRVVVLGTGTPIPDAFRAGSSIAVIHKGESYLFDAGAGAVRNAVVARYKHDIPSLYPSLICCVFSRICIVTTPWIFPNSRIPCGGGATRVSRPGGRKESSGLRAECWK